VFLGPLYAVGFALYLPAVTLIPGAWSSRDRRLAAVLLSPIVGVLVMLISPRIRQSSPTASCPPSYSALSYASWNRCARHEQREGSAGGNMPSSFDVIRRCDGWPGRSPRERLGAGAGQWLDLNHPAQFSQ
jgi:hypothetical protein